MNGMIIELAWQQTFDMNDNKDEYSDKDTDESNVDDMSSCDESKVKFIHSRMIPEEYNKEYKQFVKTSYTLYDKAFFQKQYKNIHDWSYQISILKSPYSMYFNETKMT